MKIELFKKITNESFQEDIMELITLCDHEFVPHLSARSSTTQGDLLPGKKDSKVPKAYFENIMSQNNLLAIEDGKVIGFMSFKKEYVCENIDPKYSPNLYVTTVIVHPSHRNHGITTKFYNELMKIFKKHYIFTRTWSTNTGHIRILSSLNFHSHCYLNNDRGEGIDTVYFRYDPDVRNLRQYIRQYKLEGNIYFSFVLTIITIICIIFWSQSKTDEGDELWLAFATSLLASLLCLVSDTLIKIRDSKNDTFIAKFKDFGITDIHFDKSQVLEKLIPNCRDEIWISGYRLIMTSKVPFRNSLITACKRAKNLKIKILICPPWTEIYKKTYGNEDTTANYLLVFRDLCECKEQYGIDLQIRIATHPIFSDTYKVDDRFITGSYLNCTDMYKNAITAKDFFTLDVEGSENKLFKIYYDDYMSIWDDAEEEINVDKIYKQIKNIKDFHKFTTKERFDILQSCIETIIK